MEFVLLVQKSHLHRPFSSIETFKGYNYHKTQHHHPDILLPDLANASMLQTVRANPAFNCEFPVAIGTTISAVLATLRERA
jgi:hypothetical protein